MYDCQLIYWPERDVMLILSFYLENDMYILEADELTEQECIDLLQGALDSGKHVDDYFYQDKQMEMIGHLNIT